MLRQKHSKTDKVNVLEEGALVGAGSGAPGMGGKKQTITALGGRSNIFPISKILLGFYIISFVSWSVVFHWASMPFEFSVLLQLDSNCGGDSNIHPIDEIISRDGITEGSSMHIMLSMLKNYSLPESYREEIGTEEEIKKETERCERYGFGFEPGTTRKRRRIFFWI